MFSLRKSIIYFNPRRNTLSDSFAVGLSENFKITTIEDTCFFFFLSVINYLKMLVNVPCQHDRDDTLQVCTCGNLLPQFCIAQFKLLINKILVEISWRRHFMLPLL